MAETEGFELSKNPSTLSITRKIGTFRLIFCTTVQEVIGDSGFDRHSGIVLRFILHLDVFLIEPDKIVVDADLAFSFFYLHTLIEVSYVLNSNVAGAAATLNIIDRTLTKNGNFRAFLYGKSIVLVLKKDNAFCRTPAR